MHYDLGKLPTQQVTRDIPVYLSGTVRRPEGRWETMPVLVSETDLSESPMLRRGESISFTTEIKIS